MSATSKPKLYNPRHPERTLLIVVVVVMDFMAQVQSHLMSHQYDSLLKKSNLKGIGTGGLIR